jgi:hypothetical protein
MDEYRQAVHLPQVAFLDDDLRRATPRLHPVYHLPAAASGGSAMTFDMTVDGSRFAVRCFHRPASHLQERYARVSDFVRKVNLDFLVDVRYLPDGIRVSGDVFPIVRMSWVDGTPLNLWIDDHVHQPSAIEHVRRQILGAVTSLLRLQAAHGDIQHGNILITTGNNVRLIDYDGMYLPSLRHLGASESGHRNYQHPDRGNAYDESLDLFTALLVDISLDAVAHEPSLWKEFNTAENLLFSAEDFVRPEQSEVFSRLSRMPALAERVRRLKDACGANFGEVPAILSGTTRPAARHTTPPAHDMRPEPGPPAAVVAYANNRAQLLSHEGDEITVVGLVVGAKTLQDADTTFINFGDHRRGAFTIVAWGRVSRDLRRQFNDIASLTGSWVSVAGVLDVYTHPRRGTRTPQIELSRARALRIIDKTKAETLIGVAQRTTPSRPVPQPQRSAATQAPATSTAATPTTTATSSPPSQAHRGAPTFIDDIQYRIGRLYSSPSFTSAVSSQQPSAGTQPPPPPAPAPPNPSAASSSATSTNGPPQTYPPTPRVRATRPQGPPTPAKGPRPVPPPARQQPTFPPPAAPTRPWHQPGAGQPPTSGSTQPGRSLGNTQIIIIAIVGGFVLLLMMLCCLSVLLQP